MVNKSNHWFKLSAGWIALFSLMLQCSCIAQFFDNTNVGSNASNIEDGINPLNHSSKQKGLLSYSNFLSIEEEQEEDEVNSEKIKGDINSGINLFYSHSVTQFITENKIRFSTKSKFHLIQQKPLYLLHSSWKFHI